MTEPTLPHQLAPTPADHLVELITALEQRLDDAQATLASGGIDARTHADLTVSLGTAIALHRAAEALLAQIVDAP